MRIEDEVATWGQEAYSAQIADMPWDPHSYTEAHATHANQREHKKEMGTIGFEPMHLPRQALSSALCATCPPMYSIPLAQFWRISTRQCACIVLNTAT